ncbi:hypothetical protein [Luteibacter sp. dw_328]|uniref:hypothetical protein n=1 Tax=Luteibacter sp. dw_328 TaxID=2719796 RepID=UPI001BD1E6EE|nr:hypothetical protein [Luteibacter sp. dw_328]
MPLLFFTWAMQASPPPTDAWTKASAAGTLASALIALIASGVAIVIARGQRADRKKELSDERSRTEAIDDARAASLALAVLEDMFWIESTLGYFLDFGLQAQNPADELVSGQIRLTDTMRAYMTRLHELGASGRDVRKLFALIIDVTKALDERASLENVDHPDAHARDGWINASVTQIRAKASEVYVELSPRLLAGW